MRYCHDDGPYPLVAFEIMCADGNGILPSVCVVAVPRCSQWDREDVTPIGLYCDSGISLDQSVLISHLIRCRDLPHGRVLIRDRSRDSDWDQPAVRRPQGIWGGSNTDHRRSSGDGRRDKAMLSRDIAENPDNLPFIINISGMGAVASRNIDRNKAPLCIENPKAPISVWKEPTI